MRTIRLLLVAIFAAMGFVPKSEVDLIVKELKPKDNSVDGALGISDRRTKEIRKTVHREYFVHNSITEAMNAISLDMNNANELAWAMYLVGEIRQNKKPKFGGVLSSDDLPPEIAKSIMKAAKRAAARSGMSEEFSDEDMPDELKDFLTGLE